MSSTMLYKWYFLVLTSIIGRQCLSASISRTCPNGTNCVIASSCPTIIRLIKQNKQNVVNTMWCGREESRIKACCPISETIIKFEPVETETLKSREANVKIVESAKTSDHLATPGFDTQSSTPTTYSYEIQYTKKNEITINPFPNKTVCGQDTGSDRIVGGLLANIDEFPWLGRILYKTTRGIFTYSCGASLITDRYLVTAAHCLAQKNKPLSVRLGEWDEQTERDCQNNYCADKPVDIDIEKVFIHEDYDKIMMSSDIALIKLKQPVKFTEFISPICLPTTEYVTMQEHAQDIPYETAGWGVTEFGTTSALKRKVSLNGVPSELCEKIFDKFNKTIFNRIICAGGVEGKDSCSGDSGGPLMKKVEEDYETNWYLYGITSFGGKDCGAEGRPGVYTKVSIYMDWIQRIVSNRLQ